MTRWKAPVAAVAVAAGAGLAAEQTSDGVVPGTAATEEVVPGTACNATFALTDSDKDGTITRSEYATWADTGFAMLDADGDGGVSRAEFADCLEVDARAAPESDDASEGAIDNGAPADD